MNRNICRVVVLASAAALFIGGAFSAWAGVPGSRPVNPSMVKGAVLTSKELNFTIEAPSPEWTWYTLDIAGGDVESVNFFCQSPDGSEQYLLHVMKGNFGKVDAGEILDGVEKGAGKYGGKLTGRSAEPSAIPREGSHRLTWQIAMPNGATVYTVGYAFADRYSYNVMRHSAEEGEPEQFAAFAKSLRTLESGAEKMKEELMSQFGMLGIGLLIWIGLLCAIGLAVNSVCKRPVFNAGTISAVMIVMVLVLSMIAVFRMASDGAIREDDTAELSGGVIGACLIPGIIAVLISRSIRRKKEAFAAAAREKAQAGLGERAT